jgi:hypothetical protein
LKSRGFVIGSKNKGYVRFTSSELAHQLPRVGAKDAWSDKEIFLFEIDYFWSKQNAIAKATVAPGDEKWRELILNVAKTLEHYRKPEGKKWSVFYMKKVKFAAVDVSNEEEAEIKKKVAAVIDTFAIDAKKIFAAVSKVAGPVGATES